jgi:hypothetical protein
MSDLSLQRTKGTDEPSDDVEFDVIADGKPVGRIMSPVTGVWFWTMIDPSLRDGRIPAGYEGTREAAIQAFAKCWHWQ